MENCNHELVRVQECTKCGKTFDTIPPSADWEVLEKLEADTLRFMVVDLQSGIERMDVAQRKELEEANKSLDEYRACVDKWRLWYDNASEDAKKWRRDAQDFYGALVKIAEYHGTKDEVWANNMRTIAKEALARREEP